VILEHRFLHALKRAHALGVLATDNTVVVARVQLKHSKQHDIVRRTNPGRFNRRRRDSSTFLPGQLESAHLKDLLIELVDGIAEFDQLLRQLQPTKHTFDTKVSPGAIGTRDFGHSRIIDEGLALRDEVALLNALNRGFQPLDTPMKECITNKTVSRSLQGIGGMCALCSLLPLHWLLHVARIHAAHDGLHTTSPQNEDEIPK
jgi:hypothetical protein